MTTDDGLQEWIFTFGCGQPHEGGYHAIRAATWAEARRRMFERFGAKWSMQYDSREAAGVDRWHLFNVVQICDPKTPAERLGISNNLVTVVSDTGVAERGVDKTPQSGQ